MEEFLPPNNYKEIAIRSAPIGKIVEYRNPLFKFPNNLVEKKEDDYHYTINWKKTIYIFDKYQAKTILHDSLIPVLMGYGLMSSRQNSLGLSPDFESEDAKSCYESKTLFLQSLENVAETVERFIIDINLKYPQCGFCILLYNQFEAKVFSNCLTKEKLEDFWIDLSYLIQYDLELRSLGVDHKVTVDPSILRKIDNMKKIENLGIPERHNFLISTEFLDKLDAYKNMSTEDIKKRLDEIDNKMITYLLENPLKELDFNFEQYVKILDNSEFKRNEIKSACPYPILNAQFIEFEEEFPDNLKILNQILNFEHLSFSLEEDRNRSTLRGEIDQHDILLSELMDQNSITISEEAIEKNVQTIGPSTIKEKKTFRKENVLYGDFSAIVDSNWFVDKKSRELKDKLPSRATYTYQDDLAQQIEKELNSMFALPRNAIVDPELSVFQEQIKLINQKEYFQEYLNSSMGQQLYLMSLAAKIINMRTKDFEDFHCDIIPNTSIRIIHKSCPSSTKVFFVMPYRPAMHEFVHVAPKGKVFSTKTGKQKWFVSKPFCLDDAKLSNLLEIFQIMFPFFVYLRNLIDKPSDELFNLSSYFLLIDNAEISSMCLFMRYAMMNYISNQKTNIEKICNKFPTILRNSLSIFLLSRMKRWFTEYKTLKDTNNLPRLLETRNLQVFDNCKSWLTQENILSEQFFMINCYLGHFKYKSGISLAQSGIAMMNKILATETVARDSIIRGTLFVDQPQDAGPFKYHKESFEAKCLTSILVVREHLLTTKEFENEEQFMNKALINAILKNPLSTFATGSKSTPVRTQHIKNVTACLKRQPQNIFLFEILSHMGTTDKFTVPVKFMLKSKKEADKVKDLLTTEELSRFYKDKKKDPISKEFFPTSFTVDLEMKTLSLFPLSDILTILEGKNEVFVAEFLKIQLGDKREISEEDLPSLICSKFVESLTASLLNICEEDILLKGPQKKDLLKSFDEQMKQYLDGTHTLDHAFVSDDQRQWANNKFMSTMFAPLLVLCPKWLQIIIAKIANNHSNKEINIPSNVIEQLETTVDTKMAGWELMKLDHVRSKDPNGLPKLVDPQYFLRVLSNMLQGIYQFLSSYDHICIMKSFERMLKKLVYFSDGKRTGAVLLWKSLISSDDCCIQSTLIFKKRFGEINPEFREKILVLYQKMIKAKPVYYSLNCIQTGQEKSLLFTDKRLVEMNQNFKFNGDLVQEPCKQLVLNLRLPYFNSFNNLVDTIVSQIETIRNDGFLPVAQASCWVSMLYAFHCLFGMGWLPNVYNLYKEFLKRTNGTSLLRLPFPESPAEVSLPAKYFRWKLLKSSSLERKYLLLQTNGRGFSNLTSLLYKTNINEVGVKVKNALKGTAGYLQNFSPNGLIRDLLEERQTLTLKMYELHHRILANDSKINIGDKGPRMVYIKTRYMCLFPCALLYYSKRKTKQENQVLECSSLKSSVLALNSILYDSFKDLEDPGIDAIDNMFPQRETYQMFLDYSTSQMKMIEKKQEELKSLSLERVYFGANFEQEDLFDVVKQIWLVGVNSNSSDRIRTYNLLKIQYPFLRDSAFETLNYLIKENEQNKSSNSSMSSEFKAINTIMNFVQQIKNLNADTKLVYFLSNNKTFKKSDLITSCLSNYSHCSGYEVQTFRSNNIVETIFMRMVRTPMPPGKGKLQILKELLLTAKEQGILPKSLAPICSFLEVSTISNSYSEGICILDNVIRKNMFAKFISEDKNYFRAYHNGILVTVVADKSNEIKEVYSTLEPQAAMNTILKLASIYNLTDSRSSITASSEEAYQLSIGSRVIAQATNNSNLTYIRRKLNWEPKFIKFKISFSPFQIYAWPLLEKDSSWELCMRLPTGLLNVPDGEVISDFSDKFFSKKLSEQKNFASSLIFYSSLKNFHTDAILQSNYLYQQNLQEICDICSFIKFVEIFGLDNFTVEDILGKLKAMGEKILESNKEILNDQSTIAETIFSIVPEKISQNEISKSLSTFVQTMLNLVAKEKMIKINSFSSKKTDYFKNHPKEKTCIFYDTWIFKDEFFVFMNGEDEFRVPIEEIFKYNFLSK